MRRREFAYHAIPKNVLKRAVMLPVGTNEDICFGDPVKIENGVVKSMPKVVPVNDQFFYEFFFDTTTTRFGGISLGWHLRNSEPIERDIQFGGKLLVVPFGSMPIQMYYKYDDAPFSYYTEEQMYEMWRQRGWLQAYGVIGVKPPPPYPAVAGVTALPPSVEPPLSPSTGYYATAIIHRPVGNRLWLVSVLPKAVFYIGVGG